jgi:hypothetical protein
MNSSKIFSPGDIVICVEGKTLHRFTEDLVEGRQYKVESGSRSGYVTLEKFPGLNFYNSRFRLVLAGKITENWEKKTPIERKIIQMSSRFECRMKKG